MAGRCPAAVRDAERPVRHRRQPRTTRIIVLPGESLVTNGPYRWVSHPNYLIVAGEIFVLPLVFGLWELALLFSAFNAMILWVRIRAEDKALRR